MKNLIMTPTHMIPKIKKEILDNIREINKTELPYHLQDKQPYFYNENNEDNTESNTTVIPFLNNHLKYHHHLNNLHKLSINNTRYNLRHNNKCNYKNLTNNIQYDNPINISNITISTINNNNNNNNSDAELPDLIISHFNSSDEHIFQQTLHGINNNNDTNNNNTNQDPEVLHYQDDMVITYANHITVNNLDPETA